MGDRCYWEAIVRPKYSVKCIELFDQQPEECTDEEKKCNDKGVSFVTVEANYGNFESMQEATKAGCVFFGRSGQGDNYGALVFYSDGTDFHSWPAGHNGEGWVVDTDENGVVSTDELLRLSEFVCGYLATKKLVGSDE